MGREHSSGQQFLVGDNIKGYEILKLFDPGANAFSGKAKAPNGRIVFFKKYCHPGGSSPWLGDFIDYQKELKRRIQQDPFANKMCYEFIEFFDLSSTTSLIPLRVFYQVFEWIDGGEDLRGLLNKDRSSPGAVTWSQKILFAKMLTHGINAIHKAGIIHSDLKPENLYLIPEVTLAAKFKLRVIDMDFSVIDGRRAPWEEGGGGYVGTNGYMSPEHFGGVPSKGSDAFTSALILSELLTGVHPAQRFLSNEIQYENAVIRGELTPIEINNPIERVSDLSFLNKVLNGCLRKEVDRRPTMEQVLKALNGSLDSWDGERPNGKQNSAKKPVYETNDLTNIVSNKVVEKVRKDGPTADHTGGRLQIASDAHLMVISLGAVFGRDQFKSWGNDFSRFMSSEQFRLFRNESGIWMIEHCKAAVNATKVDGNPLTMSIAVQSGMRLSLGNSDKCPVILTLVT